MTLNNWITRLKRMGGGGGVLLTNERRLGRHKREEYIYLCAFRKMIQKQKKIAGN